MTSGRRIGGAHGRARLPPSRIERRGSAGASPSPGAFAQFILSTRSAATIDGPVAATKRAAARASLRTPRLLLSCDVRRPARLLRGGRERLIGLRLLGLRLLLAVAVPLLLGDHHQRTNARGGGGAAAAVVAQLVVVAVGVAVAVAVDAD